MNILHFFDNPLNAVRSQIWIAVCTYLIALIAHHRLHTGLSLRNFLHLVEANVFEKITLAQRVDSALQDDSFEAQKSPAELSSIQVKMYRAVVMPFLRQVAKKNQNPAACTCGVNPPKGPMFCMMRSGPMKKAVPFLTPAVLSDAG